MHSESGLLSTPLAVDTARTPLLLPRLRSRGTTAFLPAALAPVICSRVSHMAGSSGNERKRPKKDTTVCFSDLPDDILLRILYFLPTKSLVSTSVLSRRWQFLWTSTRNLQLDESQFIGQRDEFMNFVDRALVLRDRSALISFSLTCKVINDASRIHTWITSAIRSNVEQLSLHLGLFSSSFVLPFCSFGCETLVKLDLQMMGCSIRVPSMICLPRLKHLSLKWVEFEDSESAEKLLSHPMLEELILSECTWCYVKIVNVNSPKLQTLVIEDKDDWSEETQVCFFGDNLKILSYEGVHPPNQYCISGSTTQLREAVILVEFHGHQVQYMDGPSNRYCKLINSLSGVQNLTLSEETAQSFYLLSLCPRHQTTLPVFDRLTRLNLKSHFDTIALDCMCLTMLYKRCPHLEHLNFKEMIVLDRLMEDRPILRDMPSCFRTHLKKVTFQIYESESDDYQDAINLLFDNAHVLEEMVIYWIRNGCKSGQVSTVEELERKLNMRPKVSENCRVSIVLV